MLGHWWGEVIWVKEMLFSTVLCPKPWTTASVGALGNIFVWSHSSLRDSGSDSGRCAQPAVPLLSRKASASTRPHCSCTQDIQVDTHKCQQWYVCYLQKLEMCLCIISATICSNVKWEIITIGFFLFLSRLFLFSKGNIIYFYKELCHW